MAEEGAVLGHVLVVDDDQGLLSIIERILGREFDVTLASSGREALDVLENTSIDLILLDIMMPEMDGLEVCTSIKSNPKSSDIPVIFMSGMEDEDTEEAALDAGAADFISKPIRPRILQTRVRMQMQNYLYLQFLEKMLDGRSTSLERLRSDTRKLLNAVGFTASK